MSGKAVTRWKYIRVPKTASVKTKSKGVCDPDPSTVLDLTATTYCASNKELKGRPIPCCQACQIREQKRNSKKAFGPPGTKNKSAANSKNATPATSDAEMYGQSSWGFSHSINPNGSPNGDISRDEHVSPVDFTCHPILDMSNGVAQLSFRIVCYCRHHKEKEGFCIQLTLRDNFGHIVGQVMTTPIMITDDHKSVQKLTPAHTADEDEVESYAASAKRRTKRIVNKHSEGEGRMKQEDDDFEESGIGAIRNKPRSNRTSHLSRTTGLSRLTSTSNTSIPPITTTTNIYSHRESMENGRRGSQSATHSESPLNTTAPSSPYTGLSPPPMPGSGNPGDQKNVDLAAAAAFTSLFPSNPANFPPVPESSLLAPVPEVPISDMLMNGMGSLSVAQQISLPPSPNPLPHISRVIPASGPKLGGIEVTLLGGNFSREALVNGGIAFGNNIVLFAGADPGTTLTMAEVSSSAGNGLGVGAQVWSENVIICTLPPSPVAGPVQVKLLGVPTGIPGLGGQMIELPAPIFTYVEEEEKDLMIQALQILGWQNSGQWQDAKSVAMNILGTQAQPMGGMMNMEDPATGDISSLIGGLGFSTSQAKSAGKGGLARQATQSNINQIELGVWNVLRRAQHPVTGVISHISTPHPATGRTLLHLAAALGFSKLVAALIGWKANVDIPDKNGFSPVHFACFYGRTECVDILVRLGRAHLEGRDIRRRTPFDVCGTNEVKTLLLDLEEEVETRRRKSTVASEVESGGEGDDEKYTTSEADFEDDRESISPHVSGREYPQSTSRHISRVNSMASIASSRKATRPVTPFTPDDGIRPLSALHPAISPAPVSPASPTSSTSSWSLPRNIPMPWTMQLPAGWQLPNVPNMPQFGRRRTAEESDRENTQEKAKEMFHRMWMQYFGDMLKLQQQQQGAQTAEMDNDPPPYSPPPEMQALHGQEKRTTSPSHGTPATPIVMEEPPSPLSLDPPSKVSLTSTSATKIYPVASTSSVRHRQPHRRQRDLSYEEGRFVAVDGQEYLVHSGSQHSSASKAVVRRGQKKTDIMLIAFWIPVLLLVLAWASYRSLSSLYRFARPALVRQATAFLQEVV